MYFFLIPWNEKLYASSQLSLFDELSDDAMEF